MSRRTVRAYNKQKHCSIVNILDSDPINFRLADVLSVWDAVSGFIEEYMLQQKVISSSDSCQCIQLAGIIRDALIHDSAEGPRVQLFSLLCPQTGSDSAGFGYIHLLPEEDRHR